MFQLAGSGRQVAGTNVGRGCKRAMQMKSSASGMPQPQLFSISERVAWFIHCSNGTVANNASSAYSRFSFVMLEQTFLFYLSPVGKQYVVSGCWYKRRQFQPMFQSIADNRNQYHWFIGREIPCDIYWNRNHQFFPRLIQTGGSWTNSSCLFRYNRLSLYRKG